MTDTNYSAKKPQWKSVKDAKDAVHLIDIGILLSWQDMRRLGKDLSLEAQLDVSRHFALRLAERAHERLQAEILVESVVVWLANLASEAALSAFLEELLTQPECEGASRALVEIALTAEATEHSHDDEHFEMAVALICELGLALQEYEKQFPRQIRGLQGILDHVATYLLSVSNSNSSCIRLSLLHYFGATEHNQQVKNCFNRVLGRFGHTVLDHLFNLLFNKRTEAVALQYLVENLPFVFEADSHAQKIVHETFKFYMLKQPERFALFVHTVADHLTSQSDSNAETPISSGMIVAQRVFGQHAAALFLVAADVNHKELGREMALALAKLIKTERINEVIQQLQGEFTVRGAFKEFLREMAAAAASKKEIETLSSFRSSKRGRRPSFAKAQGMGTIHQVTYLGQLEHAKAS